MTPEHTGLAIAQMGRLPIPTALSIWAATRSFVPPRGLFRGVLAGTKISLAVRKLRLLRPDVAVVDLDTRVSGMPGGEARISQMLVLVEEDGCWWITAQHNVMQSAGH